jgi:hypothetical protein
VRVVAAAGFDEEPLEKKIVRALETAGATKPEAVIEEVAALEQTAVGKTPLVHGLPRNGD